MRNSYVIQLKRESVCMGDDVTAPNTKDISCNPDMTVLQVLDEISQNIPFLFEGQHTIWSIENEGCPIAYLESDVLGKTTKHLMIGDIPVKKLKCKEIYCRYFYEYQGNLCNKLRYMADGKWELIHPECTSLLEHVKAYYRSQKRI